MARVGMGGVATYCRRCAELWHDDRRRGGDALISLCSSPAGMGVFRRFVGRGGTDYDGTPAHDSENVHASTTSSWER